MRYYIEKNLDFEKGVNRKDDSSNVSVLPLNEKESIYFSRRDISKQFLKSIELLKYSILNWHLECLHVCK